MEQKWEGVGSMLVKRKCLIIMLLDDQIIKGNSVGAAV